MVDYPWKYPKFDYKISQSRPFLDILLTNDNGYLSTSVYHKSASEPSVVPFISDHSRHVFGNVLQTALNRAIRYSSTFQAFENEKHQIKLTSLYNGYPSMFIEKEFQKYFKNHLTLSKFIPFLINEKQFFRVRQQLLDESPTADQLEVIENIPLTDVDKDQHGQNTTQYSNKQAADKDKKQPNNLILYYKHEKRFDSFKRDLHQLYDSIFKNTPVADIKMIVGSRNRRDARKELIHKRLKPYLLKNIPQTKKKRVKRKQMEKINSAGQQHTSEPATIEN